MYRNMTTKQEGRPRNPAISQALRQAAERRMEADGFGSLTVDGLVKEVGTTRQAFYRRYSRVSVLALEVILTRFGESNPVDTGSLEADLLKLQRDDVSMMTTSLVRKNLPGMFEDIRTIPEVCAIYFERLILPRRQNVGRVIDNAAARGEVNPPHVDAEYICDLMFGAILSRLLLPTGLPVDDHFARETVATAVHILTCPQMSVSSIAAEGR